MEDVFSHPLFLVIAGYVLSEWRASRSGQANLGQNAASFEARLQAAEAWIGRHNDVRESLSKLGEQMRTVFNLVEDIADRLDDWHAAVAVSAPSPRRQTVRRRIRR